MEGKNSFYYRKPVPTMKARLSKIWKIVSTVIVVIVVVAAAFFGGARIFGYTPYAVLSGSMTPKYKVGSLVFVKKAEQAEIKTGDVITFVAGNDKTVVTHRVVKVDEENNCFYTKGDANADIDAAPVIYENVLGRVKFSVPWIGRFSMLLSEKSGRYLVLAGFFLLCFLLLLPELIKAFKKK